MKINASDINFNTMETLPKTYSTFARTVLCSKMLLIIDKDDNLHKAVYQHSSYGYEPDWEKFVELKNCTNIKVSDVKGWIEIDPFFSF